MLEHFAERDDEDDHNEDVTDDPPLVLVLEGFGLRSGNTDGKVKSENSRSLCQTRA